MTCRVLLNHIHHVVRPQALFEPPLRDQKLHDAGGGHTIIAGRFRGGEADNNFVLLLVAGSRLQTLGSSSDTIPLYL